MKIVLSIVLTLSSFTTFAGNCDYPWDYDSKGHHCGKRAASER